MTTFLEDQIEQVLNNSLESSRRPDAFNSLTRYAWSRAALQTLIDAIGDAGENLAECSILPLLQQGAHSQLLERLFYLWHVERTVRPSEALRTAFLTVIEHGIPREIILNKSASFSSLLKAFFPHEHDVNAEPFLKLCTRIAKYLSEEVAAGWVRWLTIKIDFMRLDYKWHWLGCQEHLVREKVAQQVIRALGAFGYRAIDAVAVLKETLRRYPALGLHDECLLALVSIVPDDPWLHEWLTHSVRGHSPDMKSCSGKQLAVRLQVLARLRTANPEILAWLQSAISQCRYGSIRELVLSAVEAIGPPAINCAAGLKNLVRSSFLPLGSQRKALQALGAVLAHDKKQIEESMELFAWGLTHVSDLFCDAAIKGLRYLAPLSAAALEQLANRVPRRAEKSDVELKIELTVILGYGSAATGTLYRLRNEFRNLQRISATNQA